MAYKIYLIQQFTGTSQNVYVELDTENVDMTTHFAIADIQDLSNRKDSITQNITFKGTKTNNQAFGNLFFLNRHADVGIENKLFFNYSPIRSVDCLVYENEHLILRGSMIVTQVDADKNGNITYNTTITGKLIDFKTLTSNAYLTDLSFVDLQHHYTGSTITNSWATNTERYSATSQTYYTIPYQLGSGYVYPTIDYGQLYKTVSANTSFNAINVLNYRPAIFVKEYFDRIFAATSGYTYEIKGSDDFITKFNSLIIPNNNDFLQSTISGITETVRIQNTDTSRNTQLAVDDADGFNAWAYCIFKSIVRSGDFIKLTDIQPTLFDGYTKVVALKGFNSSYDISITLSGLHNTSSSAQTCAIEFAEGAIGDNPASLTWKTVNSQSFVVAPFENYSGTITLTGGARKFPQYAQYFLLIHANSYFSSTGLDVSAANITFPSSNFGASGITYEVGYGDVVIPAAANVRQFDFIKGITTLYNLYVYNEKQNPKHLIFEKYDDYYSLAQLQYLKDGLDWTKKIDYTKGINIVPNIQLPKNYTFTFADDKDWLNANYKNKYNEAYSTFYYVDSLGISSPKKVSVPFAPSPMITYAGTERLQAAILNSQNDADTSLGLTTRKPVSSNMRILYYNGMKYCQPYVVASEALASGGFEYTSTTVFTGVSYANASNYYSATGNTIAPVEDLHFNYPREYYFPVDEAYLSMPNSYSNYYTTQTTDLTNPNMFVANCEAYLNEVDIANLDLKTPVYVDMGPLGNSYFKVLSVAYTNNNASSTVQLQSIGIVDAPSAATTCNLSIALDSTATSASTGTATVFYAGNNGPVNILWSNGGTGTTITGLTAGTYSVVVTDATDCIATGSVDVASIRPELVCIFVTGYFSGGNLWVNLTASDIVQTDVTINFTYSIDSDSPVPYSRTISAGSDSATVKLEMVYGTSVVFSITSISPSSHGLQTYADCT